MSNISPTLSAWTRHNHAFSGKTRHEDRGQSQPSELIAFISFRGHRRSLGVIKRAVIRFKLSIGENPLASNRTYYWKVRITTPDDKPSPWSEVARFDTGFSRHQTGKDSGLEAMVSFATNSLCRKSRAVYRAYISRSGYYELHSMAAESAIMCLIRPGLTTRKGFSMRLRRNPPSPEGQTPLA